MANEKVRGFEWTKDIQAEISKLNAQKEIGMINLILKSKVEGLKLPERSTADSAGYDFYAIEHTTIPSIWKQATKYMFNKLFSGGKEVDEKLFKPTLVSTGVKAYMQTGELLKLYNRSSGPTKSYLIVSNGVGVVDKDYYGSKDNDGHIMFQFLNFGITDRVIKPGDKIGQGIFEQFLLADNDNATGERSGGFGSTGK